MKTETTVEKMLRWRLEQAGAEAPPAPRASRLLALARPWWETAPERARQLCARLQGIQLALGHAQVGSGGARGGHPVPVLWLRDGQETEASARLLYFTARDGELRLRFCLEQVADATEPPAAAWEVTFVAEGGEPLFAALATLAVDREYRVEARLSPALMAAWSGLKVTDRMPFRFVLGPATTSP
jgi:hypothetical protein